MNPGDCSAVFADDDEGFQRCSQYTNMLEELVFWMCKCEFPQNMVTLLLGLLPDDIYKVQLVGIVKCGDLVLIHNGRSPLAAVLPATFPLLSFGA